MIHKSINAQKKPLAEEDPVYLMTEEKSVGESYSAYLGSPLEDKIIPQGVYDSTHVKTPDWGH